MTYFDWFQHLQTCPLVLAGPVLRHTTFETVAVWVAVKQPCTIALTVYRTAGQGAQLGEPQMAGQATTVSVGRSLHIAVVTARPVTAALQSDRLYAYDLRFEPHDDQPPRSLFQALGLTQTGQLVSYFDHQRPTFALPPSQVTHLKIGHGSCRKAHGEGRDALPILDRLIARAAGSPYHRPHQFFHTGDQIYADDVADPMLAMCSPLGNALLGWTEALPIGPQEDAAAYHAPETLPPGQRAEVATRGAGFTGGLREKRSRVTSHLFSLGEFCALYVLMWSPSCWPTRLLAPPTDIDRSDFRRWQRDAEALQRFRQDLWRVRRSLANVPNYMIFDDHDISDDWNLNQAWCLRVLSKPLGRRAVQNALHAYALFQGWGNQPAQFEVGQPAQGLLKATEDWTRSEGTNLEAHEAIARYVGMPAYDPETGLPHFTPVEDGLLCLELHPDAIDWHTVIQGHNHSVILLDARLRRGFPDGESPISPPRLLSPPAFEQQLTHPLSDCESSPVTFVVAPTNVFHLKVIDRVHEWKLSNKRVFNTDVGDAWTINMEALAELITTLARHTRQVIILSGDIHYSSSVRLTYEPVGQEPCTLVQLTCSSLKNEETQTRLVQSRLKTWLLPERDRRWAGWDSPKTMAEIKPHLLRLLDQNGTIKERQQPDWWCRLVWLTRQRVDRLAPTEADFDLPCPNRTAQRDNHGWAAFQRQLLTLWHGLLQSRWIQNGAEVVGVNNLGMVYFTRSAGEQLAAADDRQLAIAHDLYWFSPWQPLSIMRSQYGSDLAPDSSVGAEGKPAESRVATKL